jgi:endonuclease-8
MPEGDTILRAANTMHRALAGRVVTAFESMFPLVARTADTHRLVGRGIESVSARGKHLLMTFSGGLVLHTHMRMNGSWHLYRPGERWLRPRRDMRLVIATKEILAVGFNVPVAELLTPRDLVRHRDLGALGPDLLHPEFDRAEAVRRMRARGEEAIADILLDQRAVAGIGNVFKSEILFVAGVDPFKPASRLSDNDLGRLLDIARELLAVSVRVGQRTTRSSLDPRARLWVYGRGGKPCRRCRTPIQAKKTGPAARLTYWCPRCQR